MTKMMQAIMLNFLGLGVISISITNMFMAYVKPVMRIPLLVTGAILIILAVFTFVDAVRARQSSGHDSSPQTDHPHEHREPMSAWFLLIPGIVLFFAAPPALGAYDAARSSGNSIPVEVGRDFGEPLPAEDPVPLRITDFVVRSIDEGGATVRGREVLLTGFVTPDPDGGWWLARQSMACCAADAMPLRVRIENPPPGWLNPPAETWVEVTGSWIPETLVITGSEAPIPSLDAQEIVLIAPPDNPYE